MIFNVYISRKFRHQSHVWLFFLHGLYYIIPAIRWCFESIKCLRLFFGFKSVQRLISKHRKLHIQIPSCEVFFESPGWGTYLRVWVSKCIHSVVLGRKFSCSLQGKCSMIDTSDIVICHTSKKSLDFHRHTAYTQKRCRQLIIHEEWNHNRRVIE